ncbi:hypothetical protein [Gemmata sp.]|uniref:hypothetical protein n=1 Tax=Gemmata sp. TaxID=1914242 RepID=UPI003F6F7F5F
MKQRAVVRKCALRLESLSDRVVPACTWTEVNGVVTITGDSGANVVRIADEGSTLTITCDGEAVPLSGDPVTDVVVALGSGNDDVSLTFNGAFAGARVYDVSLANGHDTFSALMQDGTDPDTGDPVASSLADGAGLGITVRGMNGHDSLNFDAAGTDVGAGATLSVVLAGGNGKDNLDFAYGGVVLGDLALSAGGGNGNDKVSGRATFDATSTGTADLDVRGGNGKDTLALLVTDNSGDDGDPATEDPSALAGLTTTADGGHGPDWVDATGNVVVSGARPRPGVPNR